jgi:ribonuclease VapC
MESEQVAFERALSGADRCLIGAPTRFELLMVSARRPDGQDIARGLLLSFSVQVIPWDEKLSDIAASAFLRYGKGRNPAGLNFGDCMSYALAKSLDAPLLFKGNDFSQTDVKPAA